MHAHRTSRSFVRRNVRAGAALLATTASAAILGGCVERELVAESEPSGALVSMNDQEAGRTPVGRDFQWYGTYDVVVRQEGYETLRTRTPVIAPPWLWMPFDFLAEILPITIRDVHRVRYELKPTTEETVDPQRVLGRGQALRERLESGERPAEKVPATSATTGDKATTRGTK